MKTTNTPQRLWSINLHQDTIPAHQAADELLLVYTLLPDKKDKHSVLKAIHLIDGTLQWQHTFEYALISGILVSSQFAEKENMVIVSTSSGNLLRGQGGIYVFNLSGTIIWEWQGEAHHYSAPTVNEHQLFVTAGANTLLVITPDAVESNMMQIPLPAVASLAALAVFEQTIYIPCRSPSLLAISRNGEVLWQFQTNGRKTDWLDQTPVLAGNILFTVSRQGTVFSLNADTGQHLWRQTILENYSLSRPVVAANYLYVGSQQGLHALDIHSGQHIWTFETTRAIVASPIVNGTHVYVPCEDHYLYALDGVSGTEHWRLEMTGRLESSPVLTKSSLIVVDRKGTIMALELPEPHQKTLTKETAVATESKNRSWAQRFEEQGDYARAAELWRESGEFEKAARAYEQNKLWQKAADLWQQADRYGKRAEALEKYARSLNKLENDQETIAFAWESAARAHAEIGQRDARLRCEKEAARHRQLPILSIEIDSEVMIVGRWSKLSYTIRNRGFGSARNLEVKLTGQRFESHTVYTETMITLPPNKTHQNWFEISPQVSGQHVPLELFIAYMDKLNNIHQLERTFQVRVTTEEEASTAGKRVSDSTLFAKLASPDGRDLPRLRQQLITFFSSDELDEIIFDLGLREDDFKSELSPKARKLIIWAVQRDRMAELITQCQKRRPHVEW